MAAPPSGDLLVRQAMTALGCKSPADLAETMGWKRGTERLIAKWLAGNNNPSYERTMELLDRCGWLTLDGDAHAAAGTPAGPLEALAAKVAELARGQALIAANLGIQLGTDVPDEALETPRRARPKRKKAAGS